MKNTTALFLITITMSLAAPVGAEENKQPQEEKQPPKKGDVDLSGYGKIIDAAPIDQETKDKGKKAVKDAEKDINSRK